MIEHEKWQELEDEKFLRTLVQGRIEKNMTADDVISFGVAPSAVDDIEGFRVAVELSNIRRYAKAIGVIYRHRVAAVPEDDQ